MSKKARLIAFYLPQFHPIPENDEWWGKGFTEWTNVAKAKPMFAGHYQPRVPADLGFYDLRLPEARNEQAKLAQAHGIEGFCYWHYWFAGRRILQRPFAEVLSSGEPNFPFCLAWANESWTGIWHGLDKKVLVEQTYPGIEDHRRHFEFLSSAFTDQRYITVEDKPLFLIYKPDLLPDSLEMTSLWRKWAIEFGFKGIYLLGISSDALWDPKVHGFDGSIHSNASPKFWESWDRPIKKIWNRLRFNSRLSFLFDRLVTSPRHVYSYEDVAKGFVSDTRVNWDRYPVAVPNWDNTPRSGKRGYVLKGSTPELFRAHLRNALSSISDKEGQKKLVFLKSWNEWAEGNYLEPDLRWGSSYLKIVKEEVAE